MFPPPPTLLLDIHLGPMFNLLEVQRKDLGSTPVIGKGTLLVLLNGGGVNLSTNENEMRRGARKTKDKDEVVLLDAEVKRR